MIVGGKQLNFATSRTHFGHAISNNLSDGSDIRAQVRHVRQDKYN